MDTNCRTDKSFKNLASFADVVLVECLHCKKRVIVTAEQGQYTVPYSTSFKADFKCNNCYKPLDKIYGMDQLLFHQQTQIVVIAEVD